MEATKIVFPKDGCITCPKDHIMVDTIYAEEEYTKGMYSCQQCKASGKCSDGRFFCTACKYDICKACAQKAGAKVTASVKAESISPPPKVQNSNATPVVQPAKPVVAEAKPVAAEVKPAASKDVPEVTEFLGGDATLSDPKSRAAYSAKFIKKLRGRLLMNDKMLKTFKEMDLDKSNTINLSEFDKYIANYLSGKQGKGEGKKKKKDPPMELNPELIKNVSEIITLYDTNKNGVIDYHEFEIAYFDIFMFCLKNEVKTYAGHKAECIRAGYKVKPGKKDGAVFLLTLLGDSVNSFRDLITKAGECGIVIKVEDMMMMGASDHPITNEIPKEQVFTLLKYLCAKYEVAELRDGDIQSILEDLAQMNVKYKPAEISLAAYCVLMVALNITNQL